MVFSPTSAFAESVMTTITCADIDSNQREFQVGWDNTHQYFANPDITNIPAHYCEGGYAGIYTIYVTDGLAPDNPVRWYNGVAPLPTPEPTPSMEPDEVPSIEPSLDPEPTPIPEPTQSESPSPEPSIEPTVEPSPIPVVTPSVTPEPQPTPSPSKSVQEDVQVVPVVTPTPTISPSREIVPQETPEPQPTIAIPAPVSDTEQFLAEVSIQLPTYLENVPGAVQIAAAAEAVMAIGSDMTPEQREESQGVVVAAVIVGQLAQVRRLK